MNLLFRQEAFGEADIDPRTGLPLDYGLHDLEMHGSSDRNDNFFTEGVLKALESDHAAGSHIPEVKVIANGHDHSMTYLFIMSKFQNCDGLSIIGLKVVLF